jgi:hypothetical protein
MIQLEWMSLRPSYLIAGLACSSGSGTSSALSNLVNLGMQLELQLQTPIVGASTIQSSEYAGVEGCFPHTREAKALPADEDERQSGKLHYLSSS